MQNFFEHQDNARRNTRLLITLMVMGVLGMGVGVYALLIVAARLAYPTSIDVIRPIEWWQPNLLAMSVAGTALVVLLASASRSLALRGGGSKVAEMLGGRLISGSPRDLLERRLLNVLEEMSIASGMPVPQAYVLDDEAGINAFAAGQSIEDAVVAVTRGCLEKLTREELQGVVAHEMSHITHGDMRINMRLMGLVFGIVCIALFGRVVMRLASGPRVSRREKDGNSRAALFVVGIGLFIIGSLGELCGKLIKAAISRQREYLADAAAVQFTRNPTGIGSALKKIGGYSEHSRMTASRAEEASHMFFSDIHTRFIGLLATHPPLPERIRRIEPNWNGAMPEVGPGIAEPQETAGALGFAGATRAASASPAAAAAVTAAHIIDSAGALDTDSVAAARAWLDALPASLHDGKTNAFSACAIAFATLLSADREMAEQQVAIVAQRMGAALAAATGRVDADVRALPRPHVVMLSELIAPALRLLSPEQRTAFIATTQALIAADGRVTLFEHLLGELLAAGLMHAPRPPRRVSLAMLQREVELLLSALAQVGATTVDEIGVAFARGASRVPDMKLHLMPPAEGQLRGLSHALHAMRGLTPRDSQRLVDAMAHCALSNQRVNADEGALIAATCLTLGIPLPIWVTQS